MMANQELILGSQPFQRAAALYVRYQVFVLERTIAREDEFDCHDRDGCVYANYFMGNQPVATGRFLSNDDGTARLTRIATLADHRRKGYATKVIQALETYAKSHGFTHLFIHAELTAKTFYEQLGYQASSDYYEEDGVLCQTLEKLI